MGRIFFAMLCCAASLLAQSQRVSGGLEVEVVDAEGAAVAGASVSLSSPEGGLRRTATSGEDGRATLSAVPSGEYALRVEHAGFAAAEIDDVEVSLSRVTRLRVALQLETVAESVEVTATAGAVDPAAVESSASLGSERIEEGPSANRNYLNFVLVAPGVAPSAGSNARKTLAGTRAALVDSGFSFGGLRGRNNALSIDGVDNRDETTGGQRVSIGLELVQEFRVAGAGGGAEHGGAAGGSVDVVTRSGTNVWHGDTTWFFQDNALNARDPEVDVGRAPQTRKYQPGVSLLGPAQRDKTFFAFALEQVWERGEEWSDAPAAAVSALNRALASPAFAGAAVGSVSRGLFAADSSETELAFKLDHHIDDRSFLATRYAFSRGRISNEVHGLDNFADRSARGSSLTRDHAVTVAYTSAPRPDLFYDLRGQFARRDMALTPNSRGPLYEIPGVVSLGQAFRLDSERAEDHWEAVGSIGRATVHHTLGFGGSLQHIPLRARFGDRFAGIFVFPTLEAFELGRPDLYVQAFGRQPTAFSTTPGGLWAEDKWRPGHGLTLTAGLRWDAQRLPAPFSSPKANVAPRVGLAWTPNASAPSGRTLVLRAGAGWFFDRYPLAYLNEAMQKDGVGAYELIL
ncbi:MAG: TonB-dependent receptor, partial [Acidobacteria bacterium]|nr:TonB-dependent receptor [Acidobacteriota bacterium]